MTPREALVALNLLPDIGPITVRRLLDRFGDAPTILHTSAHELQQVNHIGPVLAATISGWQGTINVTEELERAQRAGCRILIQSDDEYPPLLREIHDPPIVLYIKGALADATRHSVAMVGSRQTTLYGRETARRLAADLARTGLTVVSGGARGIDTAAHEGALAAGGRTVAVLGTGIDVIYPVENTALFDRIAQTGAVITQFPFGRHGDKQSFPIRNRIVAGMTQATVVVEANLTSGALITANLAADYGRQVFAVPGRVDSPRSSGCHQLIKDGAALCENVDDILAGLGEFFPRTTTAHSGAAAPAPNLDPTETCILAALEPGEMAPDQIIRQTGLPAAKVAVALLSLEMKRLVRQLPGKIFERYTASTPPAAARNR